MIFLRIASFLSKVCIFLPHLLLFTAGGERQWHRVNVRAAGWWACGESGGHPHMWRTAHMARDGRMSGREKETEGISVVKVLASARRARR